MNKKAKKFDYVLAVIFVFLVIITIYPYWRFRSTILRIPLRM
jgi:hypothetical protein